MMDAYRRYSRRHPVRFISINLILVLVWIAVIMGFSSEDADVSGDRSARVLVGIVNVIDPDANVTLENYQSFPGLENSERIVRKLAHMTEYGLLALLMFSFLYGFKDLPRKQNYIIPVAFVALLGTIDEIHQTTVAGRYGSLFDVCVDTSAAFIVICLVHHLVYRFRIYSAKKNRGQSV